ncbi:Multiple epidermal growth factor-like domains protein 10 [Dinothrombium tinctorium]|uniref:Multiple epidermal growth factor-like domains protein 10 n=1 Tax=Dinothrombium tinctorium TaxID=1965070 RepID=A0A3S3NHA0_9ACAR|nr:Multiple epidermal growth factor-like domains protein 10 [Dinothrombium tinctorium]RWS02696.1 Multiple epidermal growth factor-like domains protein 10 [Dinothrombium tinctorium]RWS05285.1 Multiple epidermal growth factor-like domains protein 10 [Dinothrombium tinctorium]
MKLQLLISLFVLKLTFALKAPNVCLKNEEYEEKVEVPTKEPYEVTKTSFCFKPPFICTEKRIEYKTVIKTETKVLNKTVQVCCEGYLRDGEFCVPKCSDDCINGNCTKPEKCECLAGWTGVSCNISCASDKWGAGCANECKCKNAFKCDAKTGECECQPGFVGLLCDQPCAHNKYGLNCNFTCDCLNGATCNLTTGECLCRSNYSGSRCEYHECPQNETCVAKGFDSEPTKVKIADKNTNNLVIIVVACLFFLVIVAAMLLLLQKCRNAKNSVELPNQYDNPMNNEQELNIMRDATLSGIANVKKNLNGMEPNDNNRKEYGTSFTKYSNFDQSIYQNIDELKQKENEKQNNPPPYDNPKSMATQNLD